MSRADQKAALTIFGVIAAVMVADWLKSRPNCDSGCKTQLQHFENHVIKTGIVTLFPGLRLFLS